MKLNDWIAMCIGVCLGALVACPMWALGGVVFGQAHVRPEKVVFSVVMCAYLFRGLGTDERIRQKLARFFAAHN